jgi:CDP-glycerol glycerophosphotransferase
MLNYFLNIIKIAALYLIRIILRIFWIFPIDKKKVIFYSHGGKQYSCNPKYIFEYMTGRYGNVFTYIWSVNTPGIMPEKYKNIKTVKYMSFQYIRHILTAGIIIYNNIIHFYLPIRKRQIVVNTWHGVAYKKISIDASLYKKNIVSMKSARNVSAKAVKYVISPCKKFTEVGSKVWAIPPEKFLPIGMPRNDILFNLLDTVISKVREQFCLDYNKKIALYAPTFRGNFRNADKMPFSLNIQNLLQTLNNKFGNDFVLLYRRHLADINSLDVQNVNVISASDYPDMQELLCAADVLITDYSSSVWDYSFTFRPCFLFTPDLDKYKEKQGFYIPIEEWPFPLAETNEALAENIIKFDNEKYIEAVKEHHAALGSYEKGTATKQLCDVLFGDNDK